MRKEYSKPALKVVELNMQVLLCGSDLNGDSGYPNNMNRLPADPNSSTIQSNNIWVSNTSSIWD